MNRRENAGAGVLTRWIGWMGLLVMVLGLSRSSWAGNLATGGDAAPQRGVYEVKMQADEPIADPFRDVDLTITFIRPDDSEVEVEGFFVGRQTYKARAYCDQVGHWLWSSTSNRPGLDGVRGDFDVKTSDLPGKLRKHPDDPHQFATDDGRWFLHIGDTGYRYVVDTEPNWKAYIDQAAEAGFTKVRTWFCRGRSDVQALYNKGRKGLDLAYWDEIDRRLLYALDTHPHVIFQLIPFGEDTEELVRYAEGDDLTRNMVAYAQARFSALPNVTWCISNDRYIKMEPGPNNIPAETIDLIGRDMARPGALGHPDHQSSAAILGLRIRRRRRGRTS